jgi:type IV pilus assembly protein PilY1
MIAYIRGHDVDDADVDGNRTEPREWLFGDSLHARPLPINFGTRATGYTTDNPGIFIVVGSNDGFMRMIRNTTTGGAQSGEEVWAFMPKEVMDKVATVRTNAPGIKHPYMVDGAPTAYINELTGDTWLFFALRRGGQALFALDITDPEAPEFMWKVTPTELSGLGYTFSAPRVIKVHVDGETDPIAALIFGGGYDLDKDYINNPGVGTDDSVGNAIFVIRADNGALLWKATHANLKDSVPSSVAILDSDGNGEHDRFYVGDTGGNVWRGDMPPTGESDWKLTQLGSFGRHASGFGGKEDDLRFFHRPDVVLSGTGDDGFDAVVITSGDRADPLDKAGGNNNWAYMIKDKNLAVGGGDDSDMVELDDLGDVTETCLLNGGVCTADVTHGWALEFEADGEKGLSTPLTIANIVYFTTYLPPGSSVEESCGPAEGNGRLYAVSLKDASAVNDYDTTTDDEERFSELKSRGIPAEVVSLPPKSILRPDLQTEETGATTRFQTYWFEDEDADL